MINLGMTQSHSDSITHIQQLCSNRPDLAECGELLVLLGHDPDEVENFVKANIETYRLCEEARAICRSSVSSLSDEVTRFLEE